MLKLKLQYFGHLMQEPTHWKRPRCWKRLKAGEKGTTEDEMVGWHHWHSGHGFWWTEGVGDGQGGLVFCGSWGHKELNMTEWLNWTEYFIVYIYRCFLIHSSADVHPGCFHVLAIVNSAVMNTGTHMSLSILVSSVCMPSSEACTSNRLNLTLFLENWLQDTGATLAVSIESLSFLGV